MTSGATVHVDLDDPAGYWAAAIECWIRGDKERLLTLLADDSIPVTTEARAWLAEALLGNVRINTGRRKVVLTARQAMQLWALFDYAPDGQALPRTDAGWEAASKRTGIPARTIKELVPKTRRNVRGHKPYQKVGADVPDAALASDPFGLAKAKNSR